MDPVTAQVSASQVAQQKAQDQATQPKQGASRFDSLLAEKAQGPEGVQAAQQVQRVQEVQKAQEVQKTQAVSEVSKAEKADLKKVNGANVGAERAQDPVQAKAETQKTGNGAGMMMQMMADIEKGQGVMDRLIQMGLSGKEFSNSELVALQAGMYKYTQELELTGKVVEKATTGLKDTLKTQV